MDAPSLPGGHLALLFSFSGLRPQPSSAPESSLEGEEQVALRCPSLPSSAVPPPLGNAPSHHPEGLPSREHPPHSVVICQTPTARQPVPKRGICSRAGHWSERHLTHMAPWQGPQPSSSRCFSSATREQSPHPPFAPPVFHSAPY